MALDHAKLDVYHRALDLLDQVDQIYDRMPRSGTGTGTGTGTGQAV